MNKQEAIEKIKNIETLNIKDRMDDKGVDMVIKDQVLDIISHIDEPQKVTIPKFVAEWIEETKGNCLLDAMRFSPSKIKEWLYFGGNENEKTFARAWLDGYKVEQEKLYTVEIPNNGGTLVLASIRYAIQLVDSNKHFPGKFTKESIEEAGFGWVFDCDGVKVVEVE